MRYPNGPFYPGVVIEDGELVPQPVETIKDVAPPYFIGTTGIRLSYHENHPEGWIWPLADMADDDIGITEWRLTETPTDNNGDPYYYIDNEGTVYMTAAGADGEADDFELGDNHWKMKLTISDASGKSTTIPFYTRVLDSVDESVHDEVPVIDIDPSGDNLFF